MEVYNVPEHVTADAYLIQGNESNSHYTTLLPEQVQVMYSEGAPEFVVDQGMLYPTPTSYGYLCTGYDPSVEWDDHHRVFGLDGQDIQYAGTQTDGLPYVYYTPSYGYTQSPFNPYNPYIPGAMIGVDGSFLGSQQYYSVPSYDGTSSAYYPMVVQSLPDHANSSTDSLVDTSAPTAKRTDGPGLKHNMSSASSTFNPTQIRHASNQTNSFNKVSEGKRSSLGANKLPTIHGGVTSGSFSMPALQGKGAQSVQNAAHGKTYSSRDQLKPSLSTGNGLTNFGSSAPSHKFLYESIADEQKGRPDVLGEQNRVLRTHKSRKQLVVKAYTRRAGNVDEQGNITISTEQYNRDDFLIDFQNAKFVVIKSYSEDDVHKSIKYNVWSSTPNGNKKLHDAYEDAQRIAAGKERGCPIFLFFSVNASGQFCGVAEMIGPVDFHKDMDFWQQDKWTGSFPVKWHIIKDVPNPTFRHIVLENNENKPVTNSRDTQEIRYRKGLEMLKIFKSYASRTSLLDDFMYYENRQKILQEEKARFLIKSYGSSYIVPVLAPPRKIHSILDMPSDKGTYIAKHSDLNSSKKYVGAVAEQVSSEVNASIHTRNSELEADQGASVDALRIDSLTISPKQCQGERLEAPAAAATTSSVSPEPSTPSADMVTVGSMPVKVNGVAESSGFLTVGTIPLDPRALQRDETCKNITNKD